MNLRPISTLAPVVALTLGVAGCAASGPAQRPEPVAVRKSSTAAARPVAAYMRGEQPHPKYPDTGYIAAYGHSEKSAREAEASAIERVSAQVSSDVKAIFDKHVVDSSQKGFSSDAEQIVRITTEFARGSLIKVVERVQGEDGFYAFAVLDREAAGAVLLPEYEAVAGEFRALVNDLDESNNRTFASGYGRAVSLWRKMEPKGVQLQAISAERSASVNGDWDLLTRMRETRARVLQSSPIRLTGTGTYAAEISSVMGKALQSLKVPVSGTSSSGLPMEVEVTETMPRGIGICCQWAIRMVLDGQTIDFGTTPVGCHSRDRQQARASVVKQLETAAPAELRRILPAVLPLDD